MTRSVDANTLSNLRGLSEDQWKSLSTAGGPLQSLTLNEFQYLLEKIQCISLNGIKTDIY